MSSLTMPETIVASLLALFVMGISILFLMTLILMIVRRERIQALVKAGKTDNGAQHSLGEYLRAVWKRH
ncbi:hypothetical protein ABEP17_02630 [Priestia flexa]|uniref:hypothetical protein n=1 Tax=Bacillaceae TaxID=186817 RepID=UPI000473EF6F|nr:MULTISPECIES: hypothetical protein [Bacillaceae]